MGALFPKDPDRLADEDLLALVHAGDARAFNASLPCGAKLIGTNPDGRYVVGTFVLVSAGRARCEGEGDVARVGFVFGDKRHPRRFTEWWQIAKPGARTGPAARPKALAPATVTDFPTS